MVPIVLLLALGQPGPASAEGPDDLVVNGSFEDPDIPTGEFINFDSIPAGSAPANA